MNLVSFDPDGSCRGRRRGCRFDACLCLRFVSSSLVLIITKRSRERKENINVFSTIIRYSNCEILCHCHRFAAVFAEGVQIWAVRRAFCTQFCRGRRNAPRGVPAGRFEKDTEMITRQFPRGRTGGRCLPPESGRRWRPHAGTSRASGPPRPRPGGRTPRRAGTCSGPT